MKRRLSIFAVSIGMMAAFLLPSLSYAETGSGSSGSSSAVTAKELEARVKAYKESLKATLDTTAKKRLETKCTPAQSIVGKLNDRIGTVTKSRSELYVTIIKQLQALSTRLKNQGVDVTELNKQIAVLQTKIDTFNTKKDTFKQELSDLKNIDCKTDPTAFQAALEKARSDQKAVLAAAEDIRSYTKDTIKPTLEAIRKQLEAAKPSTSTNQ